MSPLACDPAQSRGRQFALEGAIARGPRSIYQRDRDRIIHSIAFRRLRHKTQVFIAPDGDHYRVRLTHSLEVAQIGRVIARALGLDEDLTEALCLAHDIGHPPFGHSGEDALAEALAPHGGWDHNAHCLRVLMLLESPYCEHDGLNLTWELLEGLAKHNGPVETPPWALAELDAAFPLHLREWSCLEAQVAALADDIAYHAHDLDDGLRARLFTPDDLRHLPVVGPALAEARMASLDMPPPRLRHETIRRVINRLVTDLLTETRARLAKLDPKDSDAIRRARQRVVTFSPEMTDANQAIKDFLFARMYRHWRVNRMSAKARRLTEEVFRILHQDPSMLPDDWRARAGEGGTQRAATVVGDYVAGMTDRYAMDEHRRLTDIAFNG